VQIASDHDRLADRPALTTYGPDITSQRVVGKDEGSHRLTRDIEQGRISPLMRTHVGVAEPDRVGPTVVVDGEIDETFVATEPDLLADELRSQPSIPPHTGDEVHAVLGQEQIAREETGTAPGGHEAGRDNRPVLVMVAGKEVGAEASVQRFLDPKSPGLHQRLLRNSMIRSSFCSAESVSALR
jgi:hypothetical protein